MNPAYIYAIVAFSLWGSFPIIFDLLRFANVWEILFHRIIWSAFFITPIALYTHHINLLQLTQRVKKYLPILMCSALIIGSNWLVFVYAVISGEVLETSLGYFLSPLCSIFIGTIIFKETLTIYEKIALIIMLLAILIKIIDHQGFPWISLVLALSFSVYGAIHKKNKIPSDISLSAESWLLTPLSMVGLLWLMQGVGLSFGKNIGESLLLISMGIITITPLWFFSKAAKGMKLAQLGFFNYLTPSISFVLGLWYFNEELAIWELISFILIWFALGLISVGKLMRS